MGVNKLCKIVDIGHKPQYPSKVKGYAVFEDNFISKTDEILVDENGEEYEIKDVVSLIRPGNIARACVKVDRPFHVGMLLYVKPLVKW